MSLKKLLDSRGQELALVIGNGINRYGDKPSENSWIELLNKLAKKHNRNEIQFPKSGLSLTEFFDILDLNEIGNAKVDLQKEFCESMSNLRPKSHHKIIVEYCVEKGIPILTTNFDTSMSEAIGSPPMHKTITRGFTDYYPWECYYAPEKLTDPNSGFGIWHINGMQNYSRSVRLGLTHYMGSVHRARNWIYQNDCKSLRAPEGITRWPGKDTFLQIMMTRPLVFVGLSLGMDEVFLRWLLIERKKYFMSNDGDRQDAWYFINKCAEISDGKELFLKSVGVELKEVDEYCDLYSSKVWSNMVGT